MLYSEMRYLVFKRSLVFRYEWLIHIATLSQTEEVRFDGIQQLFDNA